MGSIFDYKIIYLEIYIYIAKNIANVYMYAYIHISFTYKLLSVLIYNTCNMNYRLAVGYITFRHVSRNIFRFDTSF